MSRKREEVERAGTKKARILALYEAGVEDIDQIAQRTDARPSYVASVLRGAEGAQSYYDLYTSTSHLMNVYASHFAGRLRYKDVAAARRSVEILEQAWEQFEREGDRAGQHHTMVMALTMANRARFGNKSAEARIFFRWLERAMRLPEGAANEDQERGERAM